MTVIDIILGILINGLILFAIYTFVVVGRDIMKMRKAGLFNPSREVDTVRLTVGKLSEDIQARPGEKVKTVPRTPVHTGV